MRREDINKLNKLYAMNKKISLTYVNNCLDYG